MAILYPTVFDETRHPKSEQKVFETLEKRMPEDWTIFHSFEFIRRDDKNCRWDGEIDFLLYHERYGLLVLEVKGGLINYRQGQWLQNGHEISPLSQARANKYAILKLLEEHLNGVVPLQVAHAVCFPDCHGENQWPPDATGIVLTGDQLNAIENFVRKVLADTPLPPKVIGSVDKETILNILSPKMNFNQTLSRRISEEKLTIHKLTEEQSELLNLFSQFKRLQIQGCAGSGKTVMAVKKARQLTEQGKRVLLLCYNQLLAKKLQKEVKSELAITANAFFEFCIERLNVPDELVNQHRKNPRLYSEVLPKLLREYLSKTMLYYDAVIVDEGQDFTPEMWEVIELLLVEDGNFYIFYDPDQNIYTSELHLPNFNMPPVTLTRNCRNTRNIARVLKPYQTIEATVPAETPEGAEVRFFYGNCLLHLETEVKRLVETEGIAPSDIVILGGHSIENIDLSTTRMVGSIPIIADNESDNATGIHYYTYMKFKGCETKVALLYQVDASDPRWQDNRALNTAMSRAVHQLIVLYKA